MKMTKVFISASMQDKEIIDLIKDTLQRLNGIEVISPVYLSATSSLITETIKSNIQSSDIVFLIITPHSFNLTSSLNYDYLNYDYKSKSRMLENRVLENMKNPTSPLDSINYEINLAQSLNKPVYVFTERGTNIDINMKAMAYFTFDRINIDDLKNRINDVMNQLDMIKKEEEKGQALIAAGILVGVPLFIWLLKNMKKQPI